MDATIDACELEKGGQETGFSVYQRVPDKDGRSHAAKHGITEDDYHVEMYLGGNTLRLYFTPTQFAELKARINDPGRMTRYR